MEFDLYIHMGDKLCSELLVRLKQAASTLEGGQILKVTAHGQGVVEDIKAWCELTEHRFLLQDSDDFYIRIKES